jgi:hypothetical protein
LYSSSRPDRQVARILARRATVVNVSDTVVRVILVDLRGAAAEAAAPYGPGVGAHGFASVATRPSGDGEARWTRPIRSLA